jgi:hypothetical protein
LELGKDVEINECGQHKDDENHKTTLLSTDDERSKTAEECGIL